jgi:ABC-type Na+ efflux pump permease subunit
VLDSGWFHDSSALPGAIILASVLALLVIVAKRFVARGQRAQIVYPVTVLMFLPVLFVFFGYLTRLMPVNM